MKCLKCKIRLKDVYSFVMKNRDEIRQEVLRMFTMNGHKNMLRAKTLTQIAEAANDEGKESLMPFKVFRDDMINNFAAQIALQYLTSKKLDMTIKCARSELKSQAWQEDENLLMNVKNVLEISGDMVITQLVKMNRKEDMRKDDFAHTKDLVQMLVTPAPGAKLITSTNSVINSVVKPMLTMKARKKSNYGLGGEILRNQRATPPRKQSIDEDSSDIETMG